MGQTRSSNLRRRYVWQGQSDSIGQKMEEDMINLASTDCCKLQMRPVGVSRLESPGRILEVSRATIRVGTASLGQGM